MQAISIPWPNCVFEIFKILKIEKAANKALDILDIYFGHPNSFIKIVKIFKKF